MFCCTLLYVHSSIAIILIGKRELIALLNLSSWCLVMVNQLFLAMPRGCLRFVVVVFPDHTQLLFRTCPSRITFYDKQDNLNCRIFETFNFEFHDGDVPHSSSYGIYNFAAYSF